MAVDFVNHFPSGVVRKQPLGPVTMNQLHANTRVIDSLFLREHFTNGEHNALEVPWLAGHCNSGTTASLFDLAYGGGTISRPATGRVLFSVAAGVMGEVLDPLGNDVGAAAILANVSDAAISSKPHIIEAEVISLTQIELRTRYLTSALGVLGNSWSSVDVAFDLAVFAQKQPVEASLLGPNVLKRRRDFLTHGPTDWNALAGNQALVQEAIAAEHDIAGSHLVNRIPKATGWFRPIAGPDYDIVVSRGVVGVNYVSTGVIEVEVQELASTSLAAVVCQAQPGNADELVVINGRCTAVDTFTFYVYAYSVAENKWERANRSFSAAFFGEPA